MLLIVIDIKVKDRFANITSSPDGKTYTKGWKCGRVQE
jgi:hypothetical protein